MSWSRKLARWAGRSRSDDDESYAALADDVGLVTQNGFTVLLYSRTSLPARFSEIFSTRDDGQTVLRVEVHRRDPDTGEAEPLGKLVIDGITPAPAGVPEIYVTLVVDPTGRLQASSMEAASGRTLRAELGRVRVTRHHR